MKAKKEWEGSARAGYIHSTAMRVFGVLFHDPKPIWYAYAMACIYYSDSNYPMCLISQCSRFGIAVQRLHNCLNCGFFSPIVFAYNTVVDLLSLSLSAVTVAAASTLLATNGTRKALAIFSLSPDSRSTFCTFAIAHSSIQFSLANGVFSTAMACDV